MVEAGHQQPNIEAASASGAVEPWVRRFEAAWRNGESPSVEAFLPADEQARQAALVELVHIDLERRLKRGEPVRVEDYLARHPELAGDGGVVVELLADEFCLRLREDPSLKPSELFERFPQYAIQLRAELSAHSQAAIPPSAAPATVKSDVALADSKSSVEAKMPLALDTIVKQLTDSGVIAAGKLESFVPPKAHPNSVNELIGELVKQKQITRFQAQQVAAGRAKSLILGNYTILDKIGAGGMGQVFKAQHRRMDRVVAIKVLPQNVMKDAAAVARFEREVKAAARLEHPNIVTAYDADQAGGVHFLVMQYVDGQDLSEIVKQGGPLPVAKAVNCILQAAKGLEFAHGEGIVHRDIKPANLLLDKKGIVKILDMGLARIETVGDIATQAELTGTGTVMGTVDYMAPEQALSTKHADARADIYSLGCTLHYLIAGHAIYDGDTLMAKLLAHRERPIPSLGADAPQELQAVFEKMVAKKVEDRCQTMSEVVAALQECVVEPTKKSSGWSRSKWLLVGGGLLGGLILLAAIVLKMQTKEGTLVVEVDQPDATVQVLNEDGKVEITQSGGKGPISISVDPGKHRLKVEMDGFQFFAQDFEMDSGGTASIKASLVEDKPWFKAAFLEWQKEVAAMPAEEQVEAVAKKLQELNPGFDGKVTWKLEGGEVTELKLKTDNATDISPVRALVGLRTLGCGGSMKQTGGANGRLSDIAPLKGMNLTRLIFEFTKVANLSPLEGMHLAYLNCGNTPVSDLSPLKGMSLTELQCSSSRVSDLSPLRGMPLTFLDCYGTKVHDLAPLQGMPLTSLSCAWTEVSDLSPLQGTSLTRVAFELKRITRGLDVIRQMSSLRSVSIQPGHEMSPADFRKKYDAGELGKPPTDINDPAFQAWMKTVAALPVDKQVDAVAEKLAELNQGFDGKVKRKIERDAVREIGFGTGAVTNIAPVRALARLRSLDCQWGKLTDLSPLSGAQLGYLRIDGNPFTDLSPLKGMPLRQLSCNSCTKLADVSPLAGMPLTYLDVGGTRVSDLSPLRGMKLEELYCTSNNVSDLSPLEGLQLKGLTISPQQITRGMDVIRRMTSLSSIGIDGQKWYPPAEFWKRYDAGEFGRPAAAEH
jgi:Leucine-rich repeat (LRR) protein/tRNA A-37 threonylcarbamoyl transferase component Bud32